jgi:hypothetical protein
LKNRLATDAACGCIGTAAMEEPAASNDNKKCGFKASPYLMQFWFCFPVEK